MIPLDKIVIGKEYVDLILTNIGRKLCIAKVLGIKDENDTIQIKLELYGSEDGVDWFVFDAEDFQEIEDYKIENL